MNGNWRAAGGRLLGVLGLAGLAIGFVDYAVAEPMARLVWIDRVTMDVAASAWMGPLSGMLMAAMATVAWRTARGSSNAWNAVASAALWGLGIGAACAASGLTGALAYYGAAPGHGAGVIMPVTFALWGLALVALRHAWLTKNEDAWAGLAHVMWGGFGILACCLAAPMLLDAMNVPDARTLIHRYNLLSFFYPLLWLSYVGAGIALAFVGARWTLFGFMPVKRPVEVETKVEPEPHVDLVFLTAA